MSVPIQEFERPYVKRLENITSVPIDDHMFWDMKCVFWEREEHEEEGTPEVRKRHREHVALTMKYAAWCLRHDFDGSWSGHPYPQPVTNRLKKIWKLAEYLYYIDDPAGFLGPAPSEIKYVMRAIAASRRLGNTDFEDLPTDLNWWGDWYSIDDDELTRPDFQAWLDAGEHDWLFQHRGTKEEWETHSLFVSRTDAFRRNRERREKEQHGQGSEATTHDGALRQSE